MDQIRKFGEQTSRILEFKPKGLEGQLYIKFFYKSLKNVVNKINFAKIPKQFRQSRRKNDPKIIFQSPK